MQSLKGFLFDPFIWDDPTYLMIPLLLVSDFYLDFSSRAIRLFCHKFCLVWTNLHFVFFWCCIKTIYHNISIFLLFRIYDNGICKAKVGNTPSSDTNTSFMVLQCLAQEILKMVGERRHRCLTPTVVLKQSPVLPLNSAALCALLTLRKHAYSNI